MSLRRSSTTGRRGNQRLLVWALALAVVGAIGVLLTFIWFVRPTTQQVETVQPADAVVLFAGASERLDTAIELMERSAAPSLVIPNGNSIDDAEELCGGEASFEVLCPDSEQISTTGEAQTIGRLAAERGWSRLIAVTSVYHAHRASFLLGRCYEGPFDVVTPSQDLGMDEWFEKVPHEWAGFLAALILQPAC